jgi:hypothetical protein
VVQVIGEMSVRSEAHRKFVQTFVLAKQVNGYYVLNDIFRYLAEEEDEEETEEQAEPEAEPAPEPEAQIQTLSSSDDLAEQNKSVEHVDKLLESKADEPVPAVAAAEKEPSPEPEQAAVQDAAPEAEAAPEDSTAEEPVQADEEGAKEPEHTRAPSPKPADESKTEAAAQQPAAPAKPSAPKTWASMFSAGGQPKPAVPAVPATAAGSSSSSSAPAQQSKKSQPAAPTAVQTSSAAAADDSQPPASPGGWQTAGQDTNKKQGRQQSGSVSAGADNGHVLGYIKNVTASVDSTALKTALTKYGKLEYFDVSRQKVSRCLLFYRRGSTKANASLELCFRRVRRPRRLRGCCCR